MPLFRSPLLVLDTETTGLDPSWARVIELAAVLLDTDGTEVAKFEALIKPDILDNRAAGALAVNHITPEMLADAPPTAEVIERFEAWCGFYSGPYATSFNVGFDRRFVEAMPVTSLRWAGCIMLRSMDAMGPAGALRPGRGRSWLWPKLSHAAEFYGVTVEGDAHRALTDAAPPPGSRSPSAAAGIAVAIRRRELAAAAGETPAARPAATEMP
jgi:DNA polymerase-3 subunit epsilon